MEWEPPNDPFADTENYELRYFPKGNERNGSTMTTTKEEITVKNLKEETLYGFQVIYIFNKVFFIDYANFI